MEFTKYFLNLEQEVDWASKQPQEMETISISILQIKKQAQWG